MGEYFEGVGDNMEPDMDGMSMRTFPQLAETEDNESVVFSFIVYESREHRDEVNARVMDDSAMDQKVSMKRCPSTRSVWRTVVSAPASVMRSNLMLYDSYCRTAVRVS
ncbi:DUF1428 family protein [Haladaptatus caseinilyticus]|uniref:DUF1428 family protein n=1 Tax=Haladaptatus caseinilyticus TaxID=2993314 RepID=UPI002E2058A1